MKRVQSLRARQMVSASKMPVEALERRCMMSVNVTSWHNDAGLTGQNNNETILTPANVNTASFGLKFTYPVVGQVYAQPLYVSNLTIPGQGVHNVIFVATQDNDVYALDADSDTGPNDGVLWHVNLGPAAATPNNYFGNKYGPYHDINPQVGITSTPVIDLSTDTMYVDAFTNDVPGQNVYSHHIHALDITTGQDKVTPMNVAAAVAGNGVGGNGSLVTWSAEQQLQRPALTLLNGTLYVAYGGYADSDPYHGWVLGFNEKTLQLTTVFNDTPNLLTTTDPDDPGEAGIWQSGAGLASDGTNLIFMSGNGDFQPSQGDYGDTVIKVTPDTSTAANPNINGYGLHVTDYFTPYNQQALSDADEDLGSGGGMIIPTQPGSPYGQEYIAAGKEGLIYVVNLAPGQMGQFNATTDNVIQEVNIGNGVFSSPAYFNGAIYYQATGDVMKKFTLTDGLLSAAPTAESSIAYPYPGATPSISSDGTANGIVWAIEYATHDVLYAYDANTLTTLYTSDQAGQRDQLGIGNKFATPTVADGEVFAGGTNFVSVFGLLSPPTAVPTAPTSLAVSAPNSTNVNLSWVNNSLQQTGVIVERSTDDVNFTQIGLASADVTTYSDATVSPNTTYYYQISAVNSVGSSPFTAPVSVTTPSGTTASDVYHFDAGSGTTVIDSAGTNPGTLIGSPLPQWVTPGEQGAAALSFSGDGIYNQSKSESAVQMTSNLAPLLGSTSTLDVWIKTTQIGNNLHWEAPAITGVEQTYGNNDINWGTLNAAGQIGIWVGDSGGIYSANPVNDGKWHNIAITRDANTGIVQLFVDGVLQGTATLDTGNKTSQFFLIGALSVVAQDGKTYTGANYFNGDLDEVQIYPTVLGLNSILALAQVPAAPILNSVTVAAGPVAALSFSVPSAYTQSIEVDRMNGSSGTWVPIATLPATATSYDDATVLQGNTYSYQVKAIDFVGSSIPSNSISVTPPLPSIVQNVIFYNNSKFDGNNGSSNLTDDNAIDTSKTALLPGQTASFANITSYSKGINGIIIDVANMTYLPRPDDFVFRVGNSNDTSTWTAAPSPTYFNDYPGRGPGGSTQITLIWNDNAIQNEWLQVILLAQPHLNLAANDVFYFGNEIGFTGSNSSSGIVTATDAANVTAHETASATVTNPYDINRDGVVDANDVAAVTANEGAPALNFITPLPIPTTAPSAPASVSIASVTSTTVNLTWAKAATASGYQVQRSTDGINFLSIGTVGEVTSYTDSAGLSPGTTYYYRVIAINLIGASNPSVATSATTLSLAPSNVTATSGYVATTISWSPVAGAISYNIYRGTSSGGESSTPIAAGVTATTYADSTVATGVMYYYYVTVEISNSTGIFQSQPSTEVSAVAGIITAIPGVIQAANYDLGGEGVGYHSLTTVNNGGAYRNDGVGIEPNADGAYDVGWTFAGEWLDYTVSAAITGYYTFSLQVASPNTGGALHLSIDGANVSGEMTVPNTGAWTTYTALTTGPIPIVAGKHVLRLTFDLPTTNNNVCNVSTITVAPGNPPAPSVPTGVIAASVSSGMAIYWTAGVNDATYNVYRGVTPGGEGTKPYAKGITGTSFIDTNASAGSTYYYTVTGVTGVLLSGSTTESAQSAEVSVGGTIASIGDGSFETPSVKGSYVYDPTAAPWQFTGKAGIEANGSAWNAANAPDGTQAAFIQSLNASTGGAISQTIAFSSPGKFQFTFSAAQRASYGVEPIAVSVDGVLLSTITPASTSFASYATTAISLSAGNHVLSFASASTASVDSASFIDKVGVSVVSLSTTPPTGVSATAGVGQITIAWTAPIGVVASYNIYRGTTSGGEGTVPLATGITATSYTDTTALPGKTYYYAVTAVAGAVAPLNGESLPSAEVSAAVLVKITGTPIGTPISWANNGDTIAQVFDGNFNTFFDAANSSLTTNWVGLDMGVARTIAQIQYAPRAGYEYRMLGGQFQASNTADFSAGVVNLFTITAAPIAGQFTAVHVNPGAAYRYVRYIGGTSWVNIAEMEVDGLPASTPVYTKLTGTPIGTQTSYLNNGDTIAQVFDGNFNSYFDAPNSSLTNWVGLDLGSPQQIAVIKYAPRAGYEWRMVGGQFQVSSTPDFSSNVQTLYTITTAPVAGQFTTINVNPTGSFEYVRYVGGTGWVNIAEMEVDGIYTPAPVKLTGTPIGTPTSWLNNGDTIAQVFDGNFNTYFDAPNSSLTNWVGLDLGSPQTITQIKYAPRAGYEWRMVGGEFQVSNTADFSSGVTTIYTITTAPVAGQFTTVAVSFPGTFRYIRYIGGTGWVNIAEMEVDGTPA